MIAASAGCTGIIGEPGGGDTTDEPPVVTPGEYCDDERAVPQQLRLLTRREYANTVRDLVGAEVDVAAIPIEPRVHGFANNAAAMAVTSRHLDAYLSLAEGVVEETFATRRDRLVTCDPNEADCARQTVERLGLRVFRRPLTDVEINEYLAVFSAEPTFDDALRVVATGLMISPSFLYRSEIGEGAGDAISLTPHETASALSYLFWGTMPDDELFAAAAQGRLASPDEIEEQARRLLADPRSHAQVVDFASQWLRTDGLTASKDAAIYPDFSDDIRRAMQEELSRFVTDVVFERNGSFRDLLVADYVHADGALAQYYGLPTSSGEWSQLPVTPASGRGGILALGAVLASHAHSNESSPIKRGVFVREHLLCQQMTAPPPDLDATPPGLDPTLTTRERFARHTADPACSGCHQYIDGVGFGFEGFDGAGGRRLEENGMPVDMSGNIVGLENLGDGTETAFDDVPQLAAIIADSDAAQQCLPLQYFRFARGVEETEYDLCAVNNLALHFTDHELNLQELLIAVATQKTFALRKAP